MTRYSDNPPLKIDPQKQKSWLGIIAFLVILVIWDVLSRFSGWSANIFPDPVTVVFSLAELIRNGTLLCPIV